MWKKKTARQMLKDPESGPPLQNNTPPYALDNICFMMHICAMGWEVRLADEFDPEFEELSEAVQDEIYKHALLLEHFGPTLGRPAVDTLKGSRHKNMKELRFDAGNGVWRVAFAFDPERRAILLCAGDKAGVSERRFYSALIAKADDRFDRHLATLKKGGTSNVKIFKRKT